MSTRSRTPRSASAWLLRMTTAVATIVALSAVVGTLGSLEGGMGVLTGGLAVMLLAAVARWRSVRTADATSTASRIGGGVPDERDRAVLHRTLSTLGVIALLGSALASAAVMSGADARTVVTSLPFALILTLVVTFVVVDRRT